MYITAPLRVDIEDIDSDVSTALSVCRNIYSEYFEAAPTGKEESTFAMYFYSQRDNIGGLIGVVIDYIRSAELLLNAYEKQQTTDRKNHSIQPNNNAELLTEHKEGTRA